MDGMFIAKPTILLEFHPLSMNPLVLGSGIVSLLTDCAFQSYNITHGNTPRF
jgi:hypothetical protein